MASSTDFPLTISVAMLLLATAALVGFGAGANFTLLAAFMATAVPDPQKRATITGYASAAMNLSGVIFSTIGGKLVHQGALDAMNRVK